MLPAWSLLLGNRIPKQRGMPRRGPRGPFLAIGPSDCLKRITCSKMLALAHTAMSYQDPWCLLAIWRAPLLGMAWGPCGFIKTFPHRIMEDSLLAVQ